MHRGLPRTLALMLPETALIFCIVAVATRVHLSDTAWQIGLAEHGVAKMFLVVFITQACLYFANLYGSAGIERREVSVRVIQAVGAASFVLAGIYQWRPNLVVGRGVFLYAAVLVIIGVAGWRMLIDFTRKTGGRRSLGQEDPVRK